MKEKKPGVILVSQDFLSSGGSDTFPELNLEGKIEINLPENLCKKGISKEKKKKELTKLLKHRAEEEGYSHIFFIYYSNDYSTIIGDAYSNSTYIIKGLVKQFEEQVQDRKSRRWNDIFYKLGE